MSTAATVPADPSNAAGGPFSLNSVLADTVGVAWRAVSGTVDPWTKNQIVYDASLGSLAPGGAERIAESAGVSPDQLLQGSEETVTAMLTMNNADPSQFAQGLKSSLSKLAALSGGTLLAIGAIALLFLLVTRKL